MPATTTAPSAPATRFELGKAHDATEPPEWRGLARDGVRLLVARPDGTEHRHFRDLADLLDPGDLLVVNTSQTLPAAFDAKRTDGERVPVHLSTTLETGQWVIEVRRADGSGPDERVRSGESLVLRDDVRLTLTAPYPNASAETSRLWLASPSPTTDAATYLARHGRPITYSYLRGRYPLQAYQTVYASQPGSAEMPSAGRPFTESLIVKLMARGVTIAPITLHTGVSSQEAHEPPLPEWYDVPAVTARLIESARSAERRVIAVGTTVVRAVESAIGADGRTRTATGWTSLVLGPERPAEVVTGMITGWHAPEASHLLLLEAVAGPELVRAAYAAALGHGYLWHEFGDSALLLP